jgi:DNA polymerase-3 subunit chi
VPRVDFYVTDATDAGARARLACRVLEKAYLAQQRVLVACADDAAAQRLDELLWTFGDGSFVPHEPVRTADTPIEAPVAITSGPRPNGQWDVLLNLADPVPNDWQQFERVAEVLDADPGTRAAARERFRVYRDGGAPPQTHNMTRTSS